MRIRYDAMADLLIVDDDTDGREALCQFLELKGHAVRCVSNGQEALQAILDKLPDLVILDLLMPELDGPSLLEILRSYLRLQSLPVIVFTGLEDSPMAERARQLNVKAVLVKSKSTFEDIEKAVMAAAERTAES